MQHAASSLHIDYCHYWPAACYPICYTFEPRLDCGDDAFDRCDPLRPCYGPYSHGLCSYGLYRQAYIVTAYIGMADISYGSIAATMPLFAAILSEIIGLR